MSARSEERDTRRTSTRQAPPMRDTSPAPEHDSSKVPNDYRQVRGWGVDLDPANRPMFPKELPSDVKTGRGAVRDWQVPTVKVFCSVEQPNLTPVFGTSCPPKGLSGLLRSYAYKYSEGTNRHWMTLILADRVDMLESMVMDALRGRPDNYVKEKGWTAKWKYADEDQRRKTVALAAGIAGAVLAGVFLTRLLRDE